MEFDWTRNIRKKLDPEAVKELNYHASLIFTLFWNITKNQFPSEVIKDITDFLHRKNFPQTVGTQEEPLRNGVYTVHDAVTNKLIEFYNVELAPAGGSFGRNYFRYAFGIQLVLWSYLFGSPDTYTISTPVTSLDWHGQSGILPPILVCWVVIFILVHIRSGYVGHRILRLCSSHITGIVQACSTRSCTEQVKYSDLHLLFSSAPQQSLGQARVCESLLLILVRSLSSLLSPCCKPQ